MTERARVHNKYHNTAPKNAVYIGRGSMWGNPFVIGRDGDRDTVCEKYDEYLRNQIHNGQMSLQQLASLHRKDLVCFCAPKRCHGDTLVTAAEWAVKKLEES